MQDRMDSGRVRQALRHATMENHRQVDAMFAGFSLDSAEGYRAFLRAHARAVGALEAVAQPDSPRLSLLADDLALLGEVVPAPLSVDQDAVERGGEGFRWGVRYALEGSRLGGGILSRQVPPGLPKAYLSAVHEKGGWAKFQAQLDAASEEGDPAWMDGALRGAETAFALFGAAGACEKAVLHG